MGVFGMTRKKEPRMQRQTEPEGYPSAVERLRRDFRNLRNPSAAYRNAAWGDIGHALVNLDVEWCRAMGVPWPKMAGKALFLTKVLAIIAAIVYPILVLT